MTPETPNSCTLVVQEVAYADRNHGARFSPLRPFVLPRLGRRLEQPRPLLEVADGQSTSEERTGDEGYNPTGRTREPSIGAREEPYPRERQGAGGRHRQGAGGPDCRTDHPWRRVPQRHPPRSEPVLYLPGRDQERRSYPQGRDPADHLALERAGGLDRAGNRSR